MSPLVNPQDLVAEPLVLRAGRTRAWNVLLVLLSLPLVTIYGYVLIAKPYDPGTSRRSRLVMGHGLLTQVAGVLFLLVALVLVYVLLLLVLSRVTADRDGVHVRRVLATRHVPWPPSRSAVLVVSTDSRSVVSGNVYVIAADGKAVLLSGLTATRRRRNGELALREALTYADTLWEWARVRGLVTESGQYVRSTSRTVEAFRLRPDEEARVRAVAYPGHVPAPDPPGTARPREEHAVRTQDDPVYVRRRPVGERVVGGVYAFVALSFALAVLSAVPPQLAHPDDTGEAAVGLLMAVPVITGFLLAAAVAWRPRLVADASGLHARGLVTRRHLPWPRSRHELGTVTVLGLRRTRTTAVRYEPAGGPAVTLHALARPDTPRGACRTAEQEADDLWAWGSAHGYVAG